MAEQGVKVQGMLIGGVFDTLNSGVNKGRLGAGVIFPVNFDFDMEKLAGIDNAKLHFEPAFFPFKYPTKSSVLPASNQSFAQYQGSYLGGDQYPPHAIDRTPWLSMATFEQTILNGDVNYEVGETNMLRYFFPANCGFSFLCTEPIVKWDAGLPDASTGSLGFRVRYKIDPHVTIDAGTEELRSYGTVNVSGLVKDRGWDPIAYDSYAGMWNGAGVSYVTNFRETAYPAEYRAYIWYNSTDVRNPINPMRTRLGSGGAVLHLNQTIWNAEGKPSEVPPTNVALFESFGYSPDAYQPVHYQVDTGAIWGNPFGGGGPDSSFHVAQILVRALYANLNRLSLEEERNLRVAAGGEDKMTSPDELRLELSTTMTLGEHIIFEPSIQYIFNPDTSQALYFSPGSVASSPSIAKPGFMGGFILAYHFGN